MHMKGSPVRIKDALDTENSTNLQANLLKSQMRLPWLSLCYDSLGLWNLGLGGEGKGVTFEEVLNETLAMLKRQG